MRCYGRRETNNGDIDKKNSQVAETSVFRAESLPTPYTMAFIDSDQDEVGLELVRVFRGMALEMLGGIHEHLWGGIYYLEVAVVDFFPQSRLSRHVRFGKGDGSQLELCAFVNLWSQSHLGEF